MVPTRRVAESFLRVRNLAEFQAFKDWVKASRDEARAHCETLESTALHRAQGRAKAYGELLDHIENAPQLLEELKDQK